MAQCLLRWWRRKPDLGTDVPGAPHAGPASDKLSGRSHVETSELEPRPDASAVDGDLHGSELVQEDDIDAVAASEAHTVADPLMTQTGLENQGSSTSGGDHQGPALSAHATSARTVTWLLPDEIERVVHIWEVLNDTELSRHRRAEFLRRPEVIELATMKASWLAEAAESCKAENESGYLLLTEWLAVSRRLHPDLAAPTQGDLARCASCGTAIDYFSARCGCR